MIHYSGIAELSEEQYEAVASKIQGYRACASCGNSAVNWTVYGELKLEGDLAFVVATCMRCGLEMNYRIEAFRLAFHKGLILGPLPPEEDLPSDGA